MRKYDLVLFDVDGTLLDTGEGIVRSYRRTINELGLKMPPEDVMKSFIGPPAQMAFQTIFGMDEKTAAENANRFRVHYANDDLLFARAYPGIYRVFCACEKEGIATAIATYKRIDYAERIVRAFYFTDYTQNVQGSDFAMKKTKKDIIHEAISKAGVTDLSRVVMIGDTVHDQKGAMEIGVDFLGVTYGFGFKSEADLSGMPYAGVADRAEDLIKLICG